MNAKYIKNRILSLMTLIIILAVLASPGFANVVTSLSSLTPERLGEGFVSTIALSPDGKVVAAAHRTNTTGYRWHTHTVFLWDLQTHEQIAEFKVDDVRSIAFSPDGTLLALGAGGHTIYLWDVAGQNQVGVINSPGPYSVQYLVFSPDGMLLASMVDSDIATHIWDLQSRSHIGAFNGRAWSAAFSPDSKTLVTGGNRSDPRIKLWDIETQSQVGALTGPSDITYDLAFSPDGSVLASAGGAWDKAVYLWNVDERDSLGVLGGHPAHVGSVAFSPDGKLLASTSFWEPTVFLWDVQTQTQLGQLTGHDVSSGSPGLGWAHRVIFDLDGKWLACSSHNGVEIWDLRAPSIVDFNSDGSVDIDDLLRLIESWGLDDPLVDISPMPWGDGIIDARDLLVMAEYMVEYENDTSGLE